MAHFVILAAASIWTPYFFLDPQSGLGMQRPLCYGSMDLSEAVAGLSELAAVGDDEFVEGDLLLLTIYFCAASLPKTPAYRAFCIYIYIYCFARLSVQLFCLISACHVSCRDMVFLFSFFVCRCRWSCHAYFCCLWVRLCAHVLVHTLVPFARVFP